MTLYHDPSLPYQRPSLVGDLLGIPATTSQHQLENQATTIVAWLVDQSPGLARMVLELFLGDYAPDSRLVGARTQLSLAKPGGGAVYPDLSVCGSDHGVQLLVEVKVDSEFHVYPEFDGREQPDVYRLLWEKPTARDARIRAVGTLTRLGSDTVPDPARLVARDVSWRELGAAIEGQLRTNSLEAEVRLVAQSLVIAIDERVAPIPPSENEQVAFFAAHQSLLDKVADEVARLLDASGSRKKIRGQAYFGWRIPLLDANGKTLFLRLYLSPAGTRLNLAGAPDALIAAPERDANGTLEASASVAAQEAGFLKTRDLDKYWLHRRVWPVEELVAKDVGWEIAKRMTATGLLASH